MSDATNTLESRSLRVSKWANLFMALSGVLAAYLSHSTALLVDGVYSAVNFASAIVASRIALEITRPPDRWFPFGYDALESLYINFRSLILLGILSFAFLASVMKIIDYALGDTIPELIFGPIIIYTLLMVIICFGLAACHHHYWKRTGSRSDILKTERNAAVLDGLLSAGTGGALMGVTLLRGTSADFLIPISDSIIVIVLVALIIHQPLGTFLNSLRELAGLRHDSSLTDDIRRRTEQALATQPCTVWEVSVLKMGRRYLAVAFIQPEEPISAETTDTLRDAASRALEDLPNEVIFELVITARDPFESADHPEKESAG